MPGACAPRPCAAATPSTGKINDEGLHRHGPSRPAPAAAASAPTVQKLPRPRRHWLALPAQQRVLDNVDFELHAGRCLGLVGAWAAANPPWRGLILALESPTSGQVLLDGQDLHRLPAAALRPLRQHMAMVFQDPATALNPRRSVGWSIAEPLTAHGAILRRRHCPARGPGAGARGPAPAGCAALSRTVFGRPAPAHCHCAGHHHAPAPARAWMSRSAPWMSRRRPRCSTRCCSCSRAGPGLFADVATTWR